MGFAVDSDLLDLGAFEVVAKARIILVLWVVEIMNFSGQHKYYKTSCFGGSRGDHDFDTYHENRIIYHQTAPNPVLIMWARALRLVRGSGLVLG